MAQTRPPLYAGKVTARGHVDPLSSSAGIYRSVQRYIGFSSLRFGTQRSFWVLANGNATTPRSSPQSFGQARATPPVYSFFFQNSQRGMCRYCRWAQAKLREAMQRRADANRRVFKCSIFHFFSRANSSFSALFARARGQERKESQVVAAATPLAPSAVSEDLRDVDVAFERAVPVRVLFGFDRAAETSPTKTRARESSNATRTRLFQNTLSISHFFESETV